MKKCKKVLALVLVSVLIVSLSSVLTSCKKVQSGTSQGELIMATNAQFPPYESSKGGKIVGLDVDMAQAIADKLGLKLVIHDMEFDSIIPTINSGKADIGVAGMTVTADRKKNVDFSDTYTTSKQVIIVNGSNSSVKSTTDLPKKKIGVQLGTTGDIYASDYEKQGSTIQRYNAGLDAAVALTQNKIDCEIIDEQPAKVYVQNYPQLKILSQPFVEESYAICLKKGNTDLLNKINNSIKELKADGTLQKIIDKYISAK
ncbi:MAG: basic amino acid ABC transporter substrate-binding protein [Bacillota bacterium]|nr:basic amino acid ABC transporter substrate-binding protein [Bacillota bacterium]